MDSKELDKVNENYKEILQLRQNIGNTNDCITKLEDDIKKDKTFFHLEISTYNGEFYNRRVSSSRLLGTKEVVRALKDAVSATKGYLHHLEKEFERR